MLTLGGTMIVHNAIERDYCVTEAVQSLCGLCDQVVILDASSTDGTLAELSNLNTSQHCQYRVISGYPWQPNGNGAWLADLTNKARATLDTMMHVNLQADEVLHEEDYSLIRKMSDTGGVYTLERLNFWGDNKHLLPTGEKVGTHIVRLAPTNVPSVGDAQALEWSPGCVKSRARIFHYGFIRSANGFVAKSIDMMSNWGFGLDPILEGVERNGMEALLDPKYATAVTRSRLSEYTGGHPLIAHNWLKKRGYTV
jgi:hypothetical protein